MKLAQPLPKTNAEEDGGLLFCSLEEGARAFSEQAPAGKILCVTDETAPRAFGNFSPRAIYLVLDEPDCLPLFLLSDDVSCVLAAGGEGVMKAARFFAEIRKVPVALFPTDGALFGVFPIEANVVLNAKVQRLPQRQGVICCDNRLLAPSLARAYACLLLSRLAITEEAALRRFGALRGDFGANAGDCAIVQPAALKNPSFREILLQNAAVRKSENSDTPRGEGFLLAEGLGKDGQMQAYLQLLALYDCFFIRGKPRACVPDYSARAARAGTRYASLNVPSPQEYAFRALVLERMRGAFQAELTELVSRKRAHVSAYCALSSSPVCAAENLTALQNLPERSNGLSAIIRDFGLFEWEIPAKGAL